MQPGQVRPLLLPAISDGRENRHMIQKQQRVPDNRKPGAGDRRVKKADEPEREQAQGNEVFSGEVVKRDEQSGPDDQEEYPEMKRRQGGIGKSPADRQSRQQRT